MKHQLFSLCALMLSLLVASPTANGQNIKQYGGKSKVSYLLMKGGTVWSTGSNVFFGLGQGIEDESANVYGYKRLELPKGFKAERIYRGYSFVFLVSKEGKYVFFGNNFEGESGMNELDRNGYVSPEYVDFGTHKWKYMKGGYLTVLAIDEDDSLWGWGSNARWQLGNGDPAHQNKFAPSELDTSGDWVALAPSMWQTLALKKDGTLWGWGDNGLSQLGLGQEADGVYTTPIQIGTDNDWQSIDISFHHALAIKKDGSLWGWGNNNKHQISASSYNPVESPTCIDKNKKWLVASAGLEHSIAIAEDGTMWGLGSNEKGQLAMPQSVTGVTALTQIGTASDWVSVVCGERYTMAQNKKGEVYVFGSNKKGPLGLPKSVENSYEMVKIEIPSKKVSIKVLGEGKGSIGITDEDVDLNSVTDGTILEFVPAPGANSKLTALKANGVDILEEKSFIITEDTEIEATFDIANATEGIDMQAFCVYPNPAHHLVQLRGIVANSYVVLYDLSGKMVLKSFAEGSDMQLDLSTLAEGQYIVENCNRTTTITVE